MDSLRSNSPHDNPDSWYSYKSLSREKRPCSKCGERSRWKKNSWDRVCINERTRKNYDHEVQRGYNLQAHFGLSQDDYNLMLFQQAGVCVLCGKAETKINPQTGRVWPLCVDHHHSTGLVRELVCHRCNYLIGLVEQDRSFVKKILKYLRKHDM